MKQVYIDRVVLPTFEKEDSYITDKEYANKIGSKPNLTRQAFMQRFNASGSDWQTYRLITAELALLTDTQANPAVFYSELEAWLDRVERLNNKLLDMTPLKTTLEAASLAKEQLKGLSLREKQTRLVPLSIRKELLQLLPMLVKVTSQIKSVKHLSYTAKGEKIFSPTGIHIANVINDTLASHLADALNDFHSLYRE